MMGLRCICMHVHTAQARVLQLLVADAWDGGGLRLLLRCQRWALRRCCAVHGGTASVGTCLPVGQVAVPCLLPPCTWLHVPLITKTSVAS